MSVYISVVEYGVQNYPHKDMAHDDKGMNGWNFMRIEYRDSEEPYSFAEYHVWMPPGVTSAVLEDWMEEKMKKSE